MEFFVFACAALMVLGGAIGVIVRPNPVHAALSLILTLFGVAVLFVAQDAHFLAAVQVIVYAGAIVVLFLFVIMLLGVDTSENLQIEPIPVQRPLAAIVGIGVIGVIGLTELSARDRRAIVGTWIGREHWGTGVNDEAKALIVHLAFAVCGMERVSAYANPDNGRSVRALEKIGFRLEGTLRGWHRHADRQLDVNIVGLLKDEWRDGAGRLSAMEVETSGLPPTAWLVAG